jgi:hypothetical protein
MLQAPVSNVSSVFSTYVASCLFGCCICFHIYDTSVYLDVTYVYNGFKYFLGVFEIVS